MKKKGFTLIELIAVIAILAVLAVVAVPRVIVYVDKSKKVALIKNSRVIYDAAEAAYNDGKLIDENGEFLDKKNGGFGSISAIEAIESLKRNGIIDKDKDFSKITEYRRNNDANQVRLRDLQVLINTPVDKISTDSKGNLAGYFDNPNGRTEYFNDGTVHRLGK